MVVRLAAVKMVPSLTSPFAATMRTVVDFRATATRLPTIL
jgi:hypothetical protein